MTLSASEYTKMTSAQRVAFLRSLPRMTVQEADAPALPVPHVLAVAIGQCMALPDLQPAEPTGTMAEAVRATIPGRPVWDRAPMGGVGQD